jgi:topoisomerase-4 subunit A
MIQGVGRGQKPVSKVLSASALAPWSGNRARKGQRFEPRIREPRLSVPPPRPPLATEPDRR